MRSSAARVAEHGGLHPHHEVALLRVQVAAEPVRVARRPLERVLDRTPRPVGEAGLPPIAGAPGRRGGRQRLEDGHAVGTDDDVGDAPAVGKADPRDHRAALGQLGGPPRHRSRRPAGGTRPCRGAAQPGDSQDGEGSRRRERHGERSGADDRRHGAAIAKVQEVGQERRGEDEPGDRTGDAEPGRADDRGPGGGEEAGAGRARACRRCGPGRDLHGVIVGLRRPRSYGLFGRAGVGLPGGARGHQCASRARTGASQVMARGDARTIEVASRGRDAPAVARAYVRPARSEELQLLEVPRTLSTCPAGPPAGGVRMAAPCRRAGPGCPGRADGARRAGCV